MDGNAAPSENRGLIPTDAIPSNKPRKVEGESNAPDSIHDVATQETKSSSEKSEKCDLPKPSTGSQLSVFAKEFVPQYAAAPQVAAVFQEPQSNAISTDQLTNDQPDPFLEYFTQVVNDVTCNPGHFEPMCRQLLSSLNETNSVDEETLRVMVETILSQAVWEPNFRYNGARLCNSLARNIQTPADIPSFRSILLNRCKQIHEDRHNLVLGEAEFLRGFALFMSELFVHMTIGEAGVAQRISVIGKAARDLLQTLLDHPTPANVKCLCQILKLCGSVLEDDDRLAHNGSSIDMEQLMKNIKTKALTHEMPLHLKEMLMNLIDLRATDWGRAPTSPQIRSFPQHPVPTDHGRGVFYGPDGQVLTAEERAFLSQGGLHLDDDDDDYDDQDDDYGGMDDEMAQAFEEFLRMKDEQK